ncbi:MAG: hypothetical protein RJQ09_21290 [Cyclobacteriaceae bacterium]
MRRESKKTLEEYLDQCRWVERITADDLSKEETKEQQEARRKKARKDFAFFVSYYFTHYAKAPTPWFHLEAAKTVLKYPNLRFIADWFRGSAKSVVFDVFLPMWLKIQEPRQINCMVLISKSNDIADDLISDLQAELEHNQKYINDYGSQKGYGNWEEGKFVTADGCSFFSVGRGQSIRGKRKGSFRPDYVDWDDVEDDEQVQNPFRVDKLLDWFKRQVILAMQLGKGRIVFAQNIFDDKSALAKIRDQYIQINKTKKQKGISANDPARTHYEISRVYVRNSLGELNWPALCSQEWLDDMILELGYAASQSELFGNPIREGKVFKEEWMQFKRLPLLTNYQHLLSYFDGGFKNNATSDSKALVLMGLHNGEYHIIKAYVGNVSRMESVYWHYDLMRWLKARNATCVFYMEEVFLLDLLYDDFKAASLEKGYHIPVTGDTRKKPDKDLRIKSTAGAFQRGAVYFNQAEENNHYMQELISQYLSFQPPKKTLKDGPDAVEGGMYLLREDNVLVDEPPIAGRRARGRNKYAY